jgi:hypothetical protein
LAGGLSTLFSWAGSPALNTQSVGGNAVYIERPTITYNLLSGHKFARSLMTPLPPTAIMSLIQAGYPAELVFRLTVKAVNGIQNRSGTAIGGRDADPRFYQLIRAFGRVQRSGAVGIRLQEEKKGEATTVMVFSRDPDEAVERDRRLIRQLLGLNPEATEFSLAFGMVPANDREVAVLSRSVLDVLQELSAGIEVPEIHVTEQRTYATREEEVFEGQKIPSLTRIHSGKNKPHDAFVAVQHQGWWYWIDDQDFISKRIFGYIMFLFSLVEEPSKEGTPIVTIPTG